MRMFKPAAIAALASLIASPAMAGPNRARSLSVDNGSVRAAVPTKRTAKVAESSLLLIVAGVVVVAGGALLLGHNDSKPASS